MSKAIAPSGNNRVIQIELTYSKGWSVTEDRKQDIDPAAIEDVLFLLKRNIGDADADAVLTKDTDDIDISLGILEIPITPTDSQSLSGKYYGTVRLFFAGGAVHDIQHGCDNHFVVEFKKGAVKTITYPT